jgi:hypothetical protein
MIKDLDIRHRSNVFMYIILRALRLDIQSTYKYNVYKEA